MNQTDPRAVACKIVTDWFHNDEPGNAFPLTTAHIDLADRITTALADAERRVLERAAKMAEMFSINKQQIHPDITWENMSESAKTVCHMTCQNIACSIRAQADKEG